MRFCAIGAIERAVNDVRSLSVQSYGVSPEITFDRDLLNLGVDQYAVADLTSDIPKLGLIGVESQMRFVLVELLQNACKATIGRCFTTSTYISVTSERQCSQVWCAERGRRVADCERLC